MSSRNRWLDDDVSSPGKSDNRWDVDDNVEDFDPTKDYFQQVVERKQNNMVESTYRSLQLLNESEQVGAATGEELVRQGEVLRNTELKVDKMEQDLKESDRHLRSIKSLWGAFMNKFSKEPTPSKPVASLPEATKKSTKLNDAITACDAIPEEEEGSSSHPVLRRQEETRQVYSGMQKEKPQSSQMQQVDDNLDLMGQSLARLKGLGLGLQNELEAQDPILDRLQGKVGKVDEKIHTTNKEMIRINHS